MRAAKSPLFFVEYVVILLADQLNLLEPLLVLAFRTVVAIELGVDFDLSHRDAHSQADLQRCERFLQ